MAVIEKLEVEIAENSKKLVSEVETAKNKIKNFENSTKESANSIKNAISSISLGVAIREFSRFAGEIISVSSDLAEVQNVVDTAFGNMSSMVEEFANSAIENFGMSELAAKKTASTYMSMSTSLGLSQAAAAEMSITIAGLSGDMASFYNISQEVASTALASIWTGETETLKKYGIMLTQTNLEEYAAAQGIKTRYSAMSEAEKVMLRYNYVLQATSNAHGDFAKTGSSFANQLRMLEENWKALEGGLGSVLMNAVTPLLVGLNELLSFITNNSPIASAALDLISASLVGIGGALVIANFGQITAQISKLTEMLKMGTTQFGLYAVAISGAVLGFSQLSESWSSLSTMEQVSSIIYGVCAAIGTAIVLIVALKAAIGGGALGAAAVAEVATVSAAAGLMVAGLYAEYKAGDEKDYMGGIDGVGGSSNESGYYTGGGYSGGVNYSGIETSNTSYTKDRDGYSIQKNSDGSTQRVGKSGRVSKTKHNVYFGEYATGGVLTEPTVGLMAEYIGAKTNPEIVTPQSIMYDTVGKAIKDNLPNNNSGVIVNSVLKLDGQTIYTNQSRTKQSRGYEFAGLGAFVR